MNKHIAFVSDGHSAQLLGILMVISELLKDSQERVNIWIGLPVEYHTPYRSYFHCLEEYASIRFFETKINGNDRFFVKLGLIELLNELPDDDHFLYLDYDHIVLQPLEINALQDGCIHVSSEVKKFDDMVHHNNSLMSSNVKSMREVASYWLEMYDKLDTLAPEKREEIAFNLAALYNHKSLLPIDESIQNHSGCNSVESSLFHYGGPSDIATKLKQYLRDLASKFQWEQFDKHSLYYEHQRMTKHLHENLSMTNMSQ